jgi:hypothetical protein
MHGKVIEVVDTQIFKEKLQMAEAIIPFAMNFLNSKKNVAKLFGVHINTITNWIENNTLKEGIHYLVEEGNIKFVPLALLRHKIHPSPKEREVEPYQIRKEIKGLV